MRIGELASRTGVSERMLRYYETEKLLRPARTAAGYRDYSAADMAVVQRIALLNRAGLTLKAIRQLLPCTGPGPDTVEPCQTLKDRVSEKLSDLDAQIRALEASRALLASIVTPQP